MTDASKKGPSRRGFLSGMAAGGAAMAHRTEHLVAPERQFHRPPKLACRGDRQHQRAVGDCLGTKAAAEIGTADQDILGRNSEIVGKENA